MRRGNPLVGFLGIQNISLAGIASVVQATPSQWQELLSRGQRRPRARRASDPEVLIRAVHQSHL